MFRHSYVFCRYKEPRRACGLLNLIKLSHPAQQHKNVLVCVCECATEGLADQLLLLQLQKNHKYVTVNILSYMN